MKKLYTFILLTNLIFTANSQIVNITDANFKSLLLGTSLFGSISARDVNGNPALVIDTNGDGEIQETEAVQIASLGISLALIEDLTGIEKFTNLTSFTCTINPLSTVDLSQNINLTELNLSSNQLTNLDVSSLVNLVTLDCSSNALNSLDVSQNNNLINLVCSNNAITNQNLTLNTLVEYLQIEQNQLTSFDFSLTPFIKGLHCSFNNIIDLVNTGQAVQLEHLSCNVNNLNSIDVTQNINLKTLQCGENNLNTIDVSQNLNLTHFWCGRNNLNEINVSQNLALQEIVCFYNNLSSLDVSQNSAIHTVNCAFNQLVTLNLPDSIGDNTIDLDCRNNLLTNVDFYNTNFFNIKSNNNLFEILDFSQSRLFGLTVDNNSLLTSINFKNNYLDEIFSYSINGTPNLQYICADEGIELDVLLNFLNNTSIVANSYCSFVPGGTFYTIQGNSKFDSNANGCDANDSNIYNNITITDGVNSTLFISNENSGYSIPVQEGNHTLSSVLENPSYFNVSPASVTVTFPTSASPFVQNFCVTANGVKNDVEVTIIPIEVARPGFDAFYKIIYKNKGNQMSNGSLSFNFNDAIMDLVTASPSVNTTGTNSLSWNFSNLNPFETREINLTFNINSPMETPAVNGGDVLNYNATIVGATDETPNDNAFTLNQTVVNSYDPNDKTCLEGTTITPSMVGQYVHYVIRFENTGTFAAQNVVIKDMIDTSKFDMATLVPQSSSHNFITRINNTNKVEFIFENINLPFDDANNDGYVAFKIKTKPTLVLGDTFSNSANIYFDFNFPIVTNTATTTVAALGTQDFEFEKYFTVYPNPAKDVLHLDTKTEGGVKAFNIYNIIGQMVLVVTNPENSASIDVANLKTGTYFIKVTTDLGTANATFVKE